MISKNKNIKWMMLSVIFLFTGCMGFYNQPKVSEAHAYIECIADKEHTATIFGDSSISMLQINGLPMDNGMISRIHPGKTTLVVSEWYDSIFGLFKFNAKAGEKYLITSKIKRINNKIVGGEFILMNRGKVIRRFTGVQYIKNVEEEKFIPMPAIKEVNKI